MPHVPPYQLRNMSTYADSWQELDQRLCTVNFVNGGHGPGIVMGRNNNVISHYPQNSINRNAASPKRNHNSNSRRRSSSHSNRDSMSRSRSSSSPVKSRSSRSRSKSESSPEKSRKSRKKNNGVKRRLVPPPDTPMSATPTCIPPEAPAPIFPNSHGVNSEQDSGKMKTGFLEMERLNQTKLEL